MIDRKAQLQFLLVLLIGIGILSFFIFKPFLPTLLLAGIFAIILYPLYKKILTHLKGNQGLASTVTILISIVCIVVPILLLSTQIFKEAVQLYGSITEGESRQTIIVEAIQSTGATLENVIPGAGTFFTNLSNNLDVYIKQTLAWLIEHLGTALSKASTLLLNLFVFFVAFYYFLRDGKSLLSKLVELNPLEEKDTRGIFDNTYLAVHSIIKGSLLIALIQGLLTVIGLLIFGVPNAILWGTVAVVAALIPSIGTSLIVLPAVLYLFMIGDTFGMIGFGIWGIVVVGLIDNLLRPKLVGTALELHPLLILLSIIGGLIFFGTIGIFLGPIVMSLLFVCVSTYRNILHRS